MVSPPDTILPIISNCLQYEVYFQAMLAKLAVFQNGEITQLLFIAQEGAAQGPGSWRTLFKSEQKPRATVDKKM